MQIQPLDINNNTLLSTALQQSPMHRLECLRVVDELVDNLDDRAVLELVEGGSEKDLDTFLRT